MPTRPLPRVIAIVGPTAVGKTSFGIALAQKRGGEVVSADSRQVYRGMNLGTGKVTKKEAKGVPHHLIDIADPKKQYSVADFVRDGRAAIADILRRGKLPIIVGGTGFYIDALVGRIAVSDAKPNLKLRARLAKLSLGALQKELKKLDPKRYKTIDIKNPRRLQRAIEIARAGGAAPKPQLQYDVEWIGITLPREELQKKISKRLRTRLTAGMLNEARALHKKGLTWKRMRALGLEYRAMADHLQKKTTYNEMVAILEQEIFKYAKRQMTWFKVNKKINWLASDS